MSDAKNPTPDKPPTPGSSEKPSGSEVTLVSLTPILNKLFFPTADYIGDEIKSFLKKKIENAKRAKRDKNLAGHFKAAGELSLLPMTEERESVHQAEKLEDWIEGAQDVSPDEGELARLWQQLLRDIVDDRPVERFLLQKAKYLTPQDARLLLRLGTRIGKRPYDRKDLLALQRLESIGFVESSLKRIWLPVILLSTPLLCLAIFAAIYSFMEGGNDFSLMFMFSSLPMIVMLFSQFSLVYLIITVTWALYPYFRTGSIRSFTLSPLGLLLVESTQTKPSTVYDYLLTSAYAIYYYPEGKYKAVKQGVSWPSLLTGPVWLVRHGLWKQIGIFAGFLLLFGVLLNIEESKSVHHSLKIAAMGFTKLAWPLYVLSMFAVPFVATNAWVESRLRSRGWIEVARVKALNSSAARSAHIQASPKVVQSPQSPASDA